MKVRALQRCLPLVALCLAAGCTFDSHPSLGWDEDAELHRRDAAVSDTDVRDAGFEADVDAAGAAGDYSDASAVADADSADASTNPVACPTGQYVGQFACRVNAAPVNAALEINFTLEQSSPDSPEATANGPILFSAGGALMVADFTAKLDCTTGAFHADISNGFAVFVLIPVVVPFVGTLDGEIDPDAGALAGSWKTELPPGTPFGTLGACEGPWQAPLPH